MPADTLATTLDGATPLADAARALLEPRLAGVAELLARAAERGGADPRAVHQLRVATRRAGAALHAFRPWVDAAEWRKARKRLRRVRRAAGAARDCDVHEAIFAELRRLEPRPGRASIDRVQRAISIDRAIAQARIEAVAERYKPKKLRRLDARLLETLSDDAPGGARATLADGAHQTLPRIVGAVRAAAGPVGELRDIKRLHELRIRVKRARYAVDVFSACLDPRASGEATALLRDLQDHMGAVNDGDSVVLRLERYAAEAAAAQPAGGARRTRSEAGVPAPGVGAGVVATGGAGAQGLGALLARCRAARDGRHAEFLDWWREFRAGDFLRSLERALPPADAVIAEPKLPGPRRSAEPGAPAPARVGPIILSAQGSQRLSTDDQRADPKPGHERLAAIDVGTNSIRLIVAEAAPGGGYRVLDDEKETTRLGRGLASAGVMSPEAMEKSIEAISRMKDIALGYGARRLRVVGTAVVREAANSPAFIARVREATGLVLETITAEEEARLAFLSAAHAFDLSDIDAAVVDIGGGSMEVVLSSSGVVERVYTMPLGAVRLTERFDGPEKAAGERFDDMRAAIKDELKQTVGRPPFTPQVLIGAGGTLSTLALMSMHLEARAGGATGGIVIAPAALRGHEMKRSEVMHLIERLRDMPLKERARVPGLPPERADIIIAGLTAAERLMKRLGVNRLRAHDGGIRDGILLTMAQELSPGHGGAPARIDPLASVRKFADACDYDRRHCDHVARLALRIFDQLAALRADEDGWGDAERTLLEAAAILHDVGYHINYTKHHLHSYHLVVHADLRGFTSREIGVVANVARYHRRAEPKMKHPGFAGLHEKDRELVRRLTAILRVADGLDRTHTQRVRDVDVELSDDAAMFRVAAEADPAVDVWGAEQKHSMFQQVFSLEPKFEWTGAAAAAPAPARSARVDSPARPSNGASAMLR